LKALRKLLAIVIGFIGVTWIGYLGTMTVGKSLSSQAQTWKIDGIGSLLGYLIVGLLKIVLTILLAIPGMIWVAMFEHKERSALTIVLCCGVAWLLLTALSSVDFRSAGARLATNIRASAYSALRTIVRLAQNTYYNVMEIILRPKPTHSLTNERNFYMPDPSEFINVETSDGNQTKAFRATLVKFQQQAKDVLPDIPNLPVHSSDYEGWFAQTRKIIAMRKQTMAANQQLELVKAFTNMYAEYHNLSEVLLKIQKNKNEMEREKQRSNLVTAQMEVERLELDAKKSEHELAIARNKAEIDKLKNPTPEVKESPRPKFTDRFDQTLGSIAELAEWKKTKQAAATTQDEKDTIERIYEDTRMKIMEGRKV